MESTKQENLIRLATVDDARGIAEVQVQSWRSSYRDIIDEQYLASLDIPQRIERWKTNLGEPLGVTFVAEGPAGSVVGFCSAGPGREMPSPFKGELYALYLLEDVKRRGLGRALFTVANAWLSENGLHPFFAWVLADNKAARRFYESLGGQEISEKSAPIGTLDYREVAYGWPGP